MYVVEFISINNNENNKICKYVTIKFINLKYQNVDMIWKYLAMMPFKNIFLLLFTNKFKLYSDATILLGTVGWHYYFSLEKKFCVTYDI